MAHSEIWKKQQQNEKLQVHIRCIRNHLNNCVKLDSIALYVYQHMADDRDVRQKIGINLHLFVICLQNVQIFMPSTQLCPARSQPVIAIVNIEMTGYTQSQNYAAQQQRQGLVNSNFSTNLPRTIVTGKYDSTTGSFSQF